MSRPPRKSPLTIAGLALLATAGLDVGAGAGAHAGPGEFWPRVAAASGRDRVDRLVESARELLGPETLAPPPTPTPPPAPTPTPPPAPAPPPPPAREGARAPLPERLARAEAILDEALAIDPGDFSATFFLSEIQSSRGHSSRAIATLERAERLAATAGQQAICWFRLGLERSKVGQYREAVASYDHGIALGDGDAAVYSNAAELLMALGRLGEAIDRYRDAIRIDERAGDRRGREHSLTFSYYGLGVALDRDEQPVAAREMIGRALALDPNAATLQLAQVPGADISFLPEGDVFYYLGLAWEVGGRGDDAGAAFQEYLRRQPRSAWAKRARAHLVALAPGASAGAAGPSAPPPPPGPPRWRVVALATVAANGPVPAPLVDAALKQRPPALEECLALVPPPQSHETVRLILEIDLNPGGAVARATARLPSFLAESGAGACIEAAIKTRLVVPKPAHARATSVRVEVLLANGDAGRL